MNLRALRAGAIIAVVLAAALAVSAPAGAAHVHSCQNVTVNGGARFGGRHALLVKVLGPVTCANAHSVTRAWYREIAAGQCTRGGNFCVLSVRGGWSCSFFSAGEEQNTGGAPLGCARHSARVRLYPTKTTLTDFNSADRKIWCQINTQGTFCVVDVGQSQHAAFLVADGIVTLCHVAKLSLADACAQNFSGQSPRLIPGQSTEADGVRCAATAGAITCTLAGGAGRGKGFAIDGADVRAVGGADVHNG